jgi:hypothetical protein
MTPLRKQLSAARDAHRGAAYPGDLAAAVLGHARVGPGRGAAILAGTGIAALAAAAAIALFLLLRSPGETPRQQLAVNLPTPTTAPAHRRVEVTATAATQQVARPNAGATASILSPPGISSIVPSAATASTGTLISLTSVSGDVPSFPSLSALMNEAGSLSDEQLQQLNDPGSIETPTNTTNTTTTGTSL